MSTRAIVSLVVVWLSLMLSTQVAHSACTVDAPSYTYAGGAVSGISMSGQASGCTHATVKLACNSSIVPQVQKTVPVTSGSPDTWSTTFTGADLPAECRCGAKLYTWYSGDKAGTPICAEAKTVFVIPNCPTCSIDITPTAPSCAERDPAGSWPVNFTITRGGTVTSAQVFWGDASLETVTWPDATTVSIVKQHSYSCPSSTDSKEVSISAVCSSTLIGDTATVDFPSCACPTISPLVATPTPTKCAVQFNVPAPACAGAVSQYVWDFGDSTGSTTDVASTSHTYAHDGTFHVDATLVGLGDNCRATADVTVSGCGKVPPKDCANVTSCIPFDGCCPDGCKGTGDSDCKSENGNGQGDECGLLNFWECLSLPCLVLGILLALAIAAFLLLVAWGAPVDLPIIGTVNLLPALGIGGAAILALGTLVAAICGICIVAQFTVIGVVLAAIVAIILLINGVTLPNLVTAIIAGAVLLVAALGVMYSKDCL